MRAQPPLVLRARRPDKRAWSSSSDVAGCCDCEHRPESCDSASACELRLAPDTPPDSCCALDASAHEARDAVAAPVAAYCELLAPEAEDSGRAKGGRSPDGVESSSGAEAEAEAAVVALRARACASCSWHRPLGSERHARHAYCRLSVSLTACPTSTDDDFIALPAPAPSPALSEEKGNEMCDELMPPNP